MFVVKRTKAAPPGPGETRPGPAAVHWAAGVAPAGNVTAWTADRGRAVEVPADLAEKVRRHHAGRPAVGRVEVLPAAPGPEAPKAEPKAEPKPEVKPEPPKKAPGQKQN